MMGGLLAPLAAAALPLLRRPHAAATAAAAAGAGPGRNPHCFCVRASPTAIASTSASNGAPPAPRSTSGAPRRRQRPAGRQPSPGPAPAPRTLETILSAAENASLAEAAGYLERAAAASRREGLPPAQLSSDPRWLALSEATEATLREAPTLAAVASAAWAWGLVYGPEVSGGDGNRPDGGPSDAALRAVEAAALAEAAARDRAACGTGRGRGAAAAVAADAAGPAVAKLTWALQRLGRHDVAHALHESLRVPWSVDLGTGRLLLDAAAAEALSAGAGPGPLVLTLPDIVQELGSTLRQETVYLEGRAVPEARATAWQSDDGATPFLYSGKAMAPAPGGLSPRIAAVRDCLLRRYGVRYDAVLINLYASGESGMRYHADPLYGVWAPETAVVSLGTAREFAFRTVPASGLAPTPAATAGGSAPLPAAGAALPGAAGTANSGTAPGSGAPRPEPTHYRYLLPGGSVMRMFGDCQESYQHAVVVERELGDAPRMSLVFKRRLQGPG